MPMLMIGRDAESSVFVEESFWQNKNKPEVNEKFAERWTELMSADKPPPNMEHFLEFMALDLQDRRKTMVAAALEHEAEIAGDIETRNLTLDEQGHLSDLYQGMRDYYTRVYGLDGAKAVGFSTKTERYAPRLVEQVEKVLVAMGKLPDEPIPAPKGKEHLAMKPSQVISALDTPYRELAKAVKQTVVDTRLGQKSKKAKDDAHKKHKKTLSTHAKCGQGIYRMVGLDEEARQIRRSRRRPAKKANDEASSQEAAAAAGDAQDPQAEAS